MVEGSERGAVEGVVGGWVGAWEEPRVEGKGKGVGVWVTWLAELAHSRRHLHQEGEK